MNKRDIFAMIVFFALTLIFGGGVGILALIVHEDNDRCHYYNGMWNKYDIARGCLAVGIGMIVRFYIFV